MTRQLLVQELHLALPWLLNGLIVSALSALLLWIGYRWGRKEGIRIAPKVQSEALAQARFERTIAEERLDTMTKVAKRYEVALFQLAEAREEKRKYA